MVTESDIFTNPSTFNFDFTQAILEATDRDDPASNDFNAIKHAGVSAVLADYYNYGVSAFFGVINEAAQDIIGLLTNNPNVDDDQKDIVNNAIGRAIAVTYPGLSASDYYNGIESLLELGVLVTDPSFEFTSGGSGRGYVIARSLEIQNFVDIALDAAQQTPIFGALTPVPGPADECFAAGTLIDMWPSNATFKPGLDGHYDPSEVRAELWQKPIEDVAISDLVVTFDENGHARPGIVDKLFTNTTKEFLRLSFSDRADLVTTPGHRFLTETGDYMEIGHMMRLGGGTVRLVDVGGEILEATCEHHVFSANSAELFPQGCMASTAFSGNTVLKEDPEQGWATYNFEVREHHNYVAGGIRVHNDSILSYLVPGDELLTLSDDLLDMITKRVLPSGIIEYVVYDGFEGGNGSTDLNGTIRTYSLNEAQSTFGGVSDQIDTLIQNNPNTAFDINAVIAILELFNLDTTQASIDPEEPEGPTPPPTEGPDNISGTSNGDFINGLGGDDTIYAVGGDDIVFGGNGNDILGGSDGDDELSGGFGDDTLYGGAGNDSLWGGGGNDFVDAGSGNDSIGGSWLNDTLHGGTGNDTVWGGGGRDVIELGDGDDFFYDSQWDSTEGYDYVFAGKGDDSVTGWGGQDSLYGGDGSDSISGSLNDDTLGGGAGNDFLYGGVDDDLLDGGGGNDELWGGEGDDILRGKVGADTFVFGNGDGAGFGSDTITDFDPSQSGEKIDFQFFSAITSYSDLVNNHLSQSGSDAIINGGNGNVIRLEDVNIGDLSSNDFVF